MPSSIGAEQRVTYHTTGNEASRLYAKKTIVVGNVSKYVIKLSKSCTHSAVFQNQKYLHDPKLLFCSVS